MARGSATPTGTRARTRSARPTPTRSSTSRASSRADLPAAPGRRWRGQDRDHLDHGSAVGSPADRVEPERGPAHSTPTPRTSTTCSRTSPRGHEGPKVRQAFAMATKRDAYVTANGGKQVMTPTYVICNPVLKCYTRTSTPSGRPPRVTRWRRRRSCRTPARRCRSTSRSSTARRRPGRRVRCAEADVGPGRLQRDARGHHRRCTTAPSRASP